MKAGLVAVFAALASASQGAVPEIKPAPNEVIVTAKREMIGDDLSERRLVVPGQRRNTVKIIKQSGMFQAEIPCDDVPGLLRMVNDPSWVAAREADYINGVRQDHAQIMQSPGSRKPKREPVLKVTFSAVDGPVQADSALERGYRSVARMRMNRTADEYRRAETLCRNLS